MPGTGTEITNAALAAVLQTKVQFSQKELVEFNVGNLSHDSYIKVGHRYFQVDPEFMYFNPFAEIDYEATVHHFTETLPAPFAESVQWLMPTYCKYTPQSRSNFALAKQDQKPDWLRKPEYLSFGALRAYPNQQDRKICISLHDRSLPFQHVSMAFSVVDNMVELTVCFEIHELTQLMKNNRQLYESSFSNLSSSLVNCQMNGTETPHSYGRQIGCRAISG